MNDHPKTIKEFTAQLKEWYEKDYRGFKTMYDKAVQNVKPIPPGQDPSVVHEWKDSTIDDLCDFFVEWYHWYPKVETGLEYIQKFSWLYYENTYGLCFVTCGPGYEMTKEFVDIRGAYMDSSDSLPLVKEWIEELGPGQMEQFITPPGGFKSFNEFFIREVKKEYRPIASRDDNTVVAAPADCVINMIVDNLAVDTQIPVKTVSMNVNQLLNDSPFAANFVGGTAVSCILMPNTYHRYHAPAAGMVVESNENVAGEYFGIKDFPDLLNKGDVGYGYDYSVFEHFHRGYFIIETEKHGCVGMIPVGLNTISTVVFKDGFKNIPHKDTPKKVKKGAELGYFQYGGSLNILLFEPGRFPSLSLLQGQRMGLIG